MGVVPGASVVAMLIQASKPQRTGVSIVGRETTPQRIVSFREEGQTLIGRLHGMNIVSGRLKHFRVRLPFQEQVAKARETRAKKTRAKETKVKVKAKVKVKITKGASGVKKVYAGLMKVEKVQIAARKAHLQLETPYRQMGLWQ
jgi:hypothetical protein